MARRFSAPYQSEPVSSLASWARNLAVFSVVAVLVSIIIVRQGFLEMQPALATFFGALGCAVLSILVCLAAFVAIWQNGSRGMSRILLALLIDAVVLAYPAYLALQYSKLPPIHDITTDPVDPPRFEALARLRTGDGTNTAVYAGLYSAEQQRLAYPDIETVELDVPVQRAYEVTRQLVTRRKWLGIDERPPQPPRRIGRIEAVARTPVMGFREDVSIPTPPDHRVAVGRHDAARDQILQMRQHGIAGGTGQPRVDADIDRAHDGGNIGFAFGEAMQDRGLAGPAVADQETHIARSFRDFRPVAREIQILVALGQPFQRGH